MDQSVHPGLRRTVRQDLRGLRLAVIRCRQPRTVRAAGEVHDNFDTVEMLRQVGRSADISDRPKFEARDWLRRTPGQPEHRMAALDEVGAQRTANEAGRTGHQDASQAPPSPRRPRRLSNQSRRRYVREMAVPIPASSVSTWPCPLSQNR